MILKNTLKILSLFRKIQLNFKPTSDYHKGHFVFLSFFIHLLKPFSTSTCSVYLQDVLVFVLIKILTGCSILSSRVLLTAMKKMKNMYSKETSIFKNRNYNTTHYQQCLKVPVKTYEALIFAVNSAYAIQSFETLGHEPKRTKTRSKRKLGQMKESLVSSSPSFSIYEQMASFIRTKLSTCQVFYFSLSLKSYFSKLCFQLSQNVTS